MLEKGSGVQSAVKKHTFQAFVVLLWEEIEQLG